jgi:hypothetical protein
MFAAIVFIMQNGEHLKQEGFGKIVHLADQLNRSGKKKYPRSQIKV